VSIKSAGRRHRPPADLYGRNPRPAPLPAHSLRRLRPRPRERRLPGADGVTLGDFQERLETELDSLQDRLIRRRYHPLPLLQFKVPKNNTKLRTLSVPTVRDRVLQTAVYQLTRETFEAEFEECSYAFREGRSVKDAVHRIDELRRQGFRWVVDADIEGFFDNIDHDRLIARLRRLPLDPYVLSLFERWIRAEIYDGTRIVPSLLNAMGFDPYLGVYHQLDYGRPSLSLDLLEEFRAPLVDRFSANLLIRESCARRTSQARRSEASSFDGRA
jgi:Reverse transcriptase (RNA-dependent DNA polymerase)/CRISPR associated protein Cas1